MDTFDDLRNAVKSDINWSPTGGFISTDDIDRAINMAYYSAGGMHKWPDLEEALHTNSKSTQEYYQYPQYFYPESIWKLTVDSVDYGDPVLFKDYLYEKENNFPSGLKKLWSSRGRQYFIYPTPTTNGSGNIVIWGFKVVATLSALLDTTIFSYVMRNCNRAICLEAAAILKMKGEDLQETIVPRVGEMRDLKATALLNQEWARLRMERMKREGTRPMWDVPDYFRTNVGGMKNTKIGDF